MPTAVSPPARNTAPRRPVLAFGAIVAALLALAAIHVEAQTAVNGQIAYLASGPSTVPFGSPTQTDIWVMNADGSNPRNLTNTSDVDEFTPAWSADGTRIAYVSDAFTQTLMIMGADGTNPTPIATGATFPTWNPAGTEVAYVRGRDGLPVNIVIRTLATGAEREITGPVDFGNGVFIDVDEMEPSWSPTGDRIAFTSVRPEMMVNPITGELEVAAQYRDRHRQHRRVGRADRQRRNAGQRSRNLPRGGSFPVVVAGWPHRALHEPGTGAGLLRAVAGLGGQPGRQRGHEPHERRDGERSVSVVVARRHADSLHARRRRRLQPLHHACSHVATPCHGRCDPGRDRAGRTVGRCTNRTGYATDVRR